MVDKTPSKPRATRYPPEIDEWIESLVSPYRSASSILIEIAIDAKARGYGKRRLEDKQLRAGTLRKG